MRRSSNRLPKPSLEWAQGLNDKEKFLDLVGSSTQLLTQLLFLVDHKLKELERKEMDEEVYKSAGYKDWQSYINGKKAGLYEIRSLLEFLE